MGEHERAARLHEHSHGLGPLGVPAGRADEHGIAGRLVEETLPGG